YADRAARRFGRNAHHLPGAGRSHGPQLISVEIHTDALSRDIRDSIATDNLAEPPQTFRLDGTERLTLGHVDMLRHLAHHLLEPSVDGRLRLIGVLDLMGYAAAFHDEIEWTRLERDFSFVVNVVKCLHYVTPLPPALDRFVPGPDVPAPADAGAITRPLRAIVQ